MGRPKENEIRGGEVITLDPPIPGVTVRVNAMAGDSERKGVMVKVTGGEGRNVYQITSRARGVDSGTGKLNFEEWYVMSGGGHKLTSVPQSNSDGSKVKGPFKWNNWFHDQLIREKHLGLWSPVSEEGSTLIFFDRPSIDKHLPGVHYFVAITFILVNKGLVGAVKWRTTTANPDDYSFTAKSLPLTTELVNLARDAFARHGTKKSALNADGRYTMSQAIGIPGLKTQPGVDEQLALLVVPNAMI